MKINNFKQHINEIQKMISLHEPTDQEIKEAEEYLEKGVDPDWDISKFGYFSIDVSGKYSVYYTFWRITLLRNEFITNLSTDFMTAIEKAKKAAGRIPVLIDRYGTKSGLFQAARAEIVTFGKYRGKSLGEIFVEDPKYLVYLYKTYGEYKTTLPYDKIVYYKDLYFETITKKNLEESKSTHIGKIGEKIKIKANVYDVIIEQNQFNNALQYKCKLVDDDGNKYMTYNIGKPVKKGDDVIMTAKVKAHIEILGIKFTQIYFCKIERIFNFEDEKSKYNL